MKWNNTLKDSLPKDKEEVLLSVEGVNYIAIYNTSEKGFQLKGTNKFIWITEKGSTIYWQKLTSP